MGTARTVGLVALGAVLFISLLSANAAIALDRTALDSEYTKEKADDAGLYATLATELEDEVDSGGATDGSTEDALLERPPDELFAAALTENYIRSESERNIDAVYDYLHGETSVLRIEVDTDRLKNNIMTEVQADVETTDLSEIMPAADETDRLPAEAGIEEMAESQSSFESAREAFRADLKAEIQAETNRELSDAQLERELDSRMDEIRAELLDQMDKRIEESLAEQEREFDDAGAELEAPIRTLQTARIDALTGETDYETYAQTVEEGRANLNEGIVSLVESELDSALSDRVELSDELGAEETETLETAQTGVSILSTLSLVLPAITLAVAGAIAWFGTRSIAAIEIGTVSLLAGVIGAVGSVVADDQFRELFDPADAPPGGGEFVTAFVGGILATLTWQSAILIVVGIGAVSLGVAIRREYV